MSKDDREQMTEAEKKRRGELEIKVRKRVAYEEKAHRIVERLLENPIEESFLIDCAKFITPSHYQDVTEERAITKACGYPICRNCIKEMPKQKYHISLKANQVYDLTERKNFCSNKCYKASLFYKNQVPTSPVWAREKDNPPVITLLQEKHNRGQTGEAVLKKASADIKEELQYLEENEKANLKHKSSQGKSTDEETNISTLDEVTEIFKDQVKISSEDDLPVVTTEKSLADQLTETFFLDKESDAEDMGSQSCENVKYTASKHESKEIKDSVSEGKGSGHGGATKETNKQGGLKDTSSVKSKTDLLMKLLDKRDGLQKELNTYKEKKDYTDSRKVKNSVKTSQSTPSEVKSERTANSSCTKKKKVPTATLR